MKNSSIATMLRDRRQLFFVTIVEVSEKTGIHRNTIKDWEDFCGPLVKIERWADLLGCELTLVEKPEDTGE